MVVISAVREAGYRIWNGNCQNLNHEDETDLADLIDEKYGHDVLLAALKITLRLQDEGETMSSVTRDRIDQIIREYES